MSLTLLLDLDNTLLENEMSRFLPAYIDRLANYLADFVDPDRLYPSLVAGTELMIQNNHPDRTLKEVFDGFFYPSIGVRLEDLKDKIQAFYEHEFPNLKALTSPNPEAVEFVENALSRGYRLIVATNPLFPEIAIKQRLDWAGLSPEKYPFALITSYENSHFGKPNPAYYAEIIGKFAYPEEPVIMVGDNPYNDIYPANQLGIIGFWVRQPHSTYLDFETSQVPKEFLNSIQHSNSIGRLREVLPWIDNSDPEHLIPDYNSPSAIIAVLRATPAVILSKVSSIPVRFWNTRVFEDHWSLTEIFCHLRDVEEKVHMKRLKIVMQTENPFLSGEDTDSWSEEFQYLLQNGEEALHTFIEERKHTLSILENLESDDWCRPARHAIFGPTHLQELCHIIVGHDQLHIRQIIELINALSYENKNYNTEKSPITSGE